MSAYGTTIARRGTSITAVGTSFTFVGLLLTQYLADRTLPHTGHRTTVTIVGQIDGAVGGQPIKNAHITISTMKPRKKVTKADGLYKFARLKPGTYIITVIAQGYVTQTKTLTINTPHTVRQNFFMVVTTGGGTTGPNTTTNSTE